jgi:hypothetical protein
MYFARSSLAINFTQSTWVYVLYIHKCYFPVHFVPVRYVPVHYLLTFLRARTIHLRKSYNQQSSTNPWIGWAFRLT